eukprot:5275729-Amphidinium_carterae.1
MRSSRLRCSRRARQRGWTRYSNLEAGTWRSCMKIAKLLDLRPGAERYDYSAMQSTFGLSQQHLLELMLKCKTGRALAGVRAYKSVHAVRPSHFTSALDDACGKPQEYWRIFTDGSHSPGNGTGWGFVAVPPAVVADELNLPFLPSGWGQ